MKILISFILFLNISGIAHSQSDPDSLTLKVEQLKQQVASSKDVDWHSTIKSLNDICATGISARNNAVITEEVEPFFKTNQKLLRSFDEGYSDLNYFIGLAYTNLGAYDKAIPYCEIAHTILSGRDAVDDVKLMTRKIILSHLYYSTNQVRKALKINQEGLHLAEKSENLNYQFRFLMNGGNAFQAKGEFDQASLYFERAYEIISRINPNPLFLQTVKTNLGAVYIASNDNKKAKDALTEALKIALSTSDNKATGEIYDRLSTFILFNDLSKVYANLNQPDSALYWSNRTIKGIDRLYPDGHAYTGEFLLTRGHAHIVRSNYDSAVKILNSSIRLNNKFLGINNALSAEAHLELGNIMVQKSKFDEAHKLYQKALSSLIVDYQPGKNHLPDSNNVSISPRSLIATLYEIAQTHSVQYQIDKNKNQLQRALKTYLVLSTYIEKFKASLNSTNSRLLFSSNYKEIYEGAIATAYQLYELEGKSEYILYALNWMEKNKGNELFISLNKSLLRHDTQDSLLALENDLKTQIIYLEEKEQKTQDSTSSKNIESSIFKLRNRLQEVLALVKEKYPKFYQIKYGNRELTLGDINEVLSDDISLTSYFVGEQAVYFINMDKKKQHFGKLNTSTKELRTSINRLNHDLKARSSGFYITSHKIFNLLKSSISETHKTLIILPDGILNSLNFDYLITAHKPDVTNFLIENTQISYAPSLNYLLQTLIKEYQEIDHSVAVYAPTFSDDPELLAAVIQRSSTDTKELARLPYAQIEARLISQLFSSKPNIGESATETNFRQDNSSVIHLATHAILDQENPLNSKLLLEEDSLNDGYVHLYELYNLQLNADLVSLSACNTGIGKYYAGEGTMSLAHGFMYAGVPNVMMSLWSVPDKSTSEIMQDFYKYLKNGYGKPAALRRAKLNYLANADQNTLHPYFWAGFVFIGNPETESNFIDDYWMPIAGLSISLIAFGLIYYRKRRVS